MLQRGNTVDILIDVAHWSWHPQRETRATGGGDLWIASCRFGICVGGRHPSIKDGTKKSDDIFTVNHTYFTEASVVSDPHELEYCPARTAHYSPNTTPVTGFELVMNQTAESNPVTEVTDVSSSVEAAPNALVPEASFHVAEVFIEGGLNVDASPFSPGEQWKPDESVSTNSVVCAAALTIPFSKEQFFQAEALGTIVEPQCGGCKCSKCPVPGSLYSFKEQKEFDLIMKNLQYDKEKKRWFTNYPWKCERLPCPRTKQLL